VTAARLVARYQSLYAGAVLHDPPRIAAALLTGGSSRRMGRTKALLVYRGSTLAERLALILARTVDAVVEVGPGVTSLASTCEDPPGQGPLAALVAGARALRHSGHEGPVLAVACDLPFLSESTLARLVGWRAAGSVVPVVRGRHQPLCARWSPDDLDAAEALVKSGERTFQPLLARSSITFVTETQWGVTIDDEEFADVDTPDDLRRLGLAR
jgi:molybdenum cofactor guanylyltransferase